MVFGEWFSQIPNSIYLMVAKALSWSSPRRTECPSLISLKSKFRQLIILLLEKAIVRFRLQLFVIQTNCGPKGCFDETFLAGHLVFLDNPN